MLKELSRRVSFEIFCSALRECTTAIKIDADDLPSVHRDKILSDTPEVIQTLFGRHESATDIALITDFMVREFGYTSYGFIQFSLSKKPIFRVILLNGFVCGVSVDLSRFIHTLEKEYALKHPAFSHRISDPRVSAFERFLISDDSNYYYIEDTSGYLYLKGEEKPIANTGPTVNDMEINKNVLFVFAIALLFAAMLLIVASSTSGGTI